MTTYCDEATTAYCDGTPAREDPAGYMRSLRARYKAIPDEGHPVPHGTTNRYSNYGCRCEACREAAREYHRGLRERAGRTTTVYSIPSLPHHLRGDYPGQLAYRTEVLQNGCWEFKGFIDKRSGYGFLGRKAGGNRAHRLAWELRNGSIPEGLVLDHTCHNGTDCLGGPTCMHRRCVNPDHLELVTVAENVSRGNGISARNALKTHCIRGHEFTPENTKQDSRGGRACRACITLHSQGRRAP